ncbi:hypothetical protein CEV32_4172 [Brucella rhizosphaerae]|uniref:Uncharacterized protein n=1 Tax=Brucella rhizosphaerae TaxID=571254 RepID=A0A256FNX4_9HYPH|nr:hypothetical protein CEV32_4172 [Brucella rhizosphaerae]
MRLVPEIWIASFPPGSAYLPWKTVHFVFGLKYQSGNLDQPKD